MSRRLDWDRARLRGRPTLDHRHEFETQDRAARYLAAVDRRHQEGRTSATATSTSRTRSS